MTPGPGSAAPGPRTAAPAVVAHRGASAELAEHTLRAYEQALLDGADAVECDVRLTRDGHLVCVHDRRVDRTSTGRGVVSAMTLEGMTELDYGSWHDPWPASADALLEDNDRVALPPPDPGEETPGPAGLLTLTALLELVADSSATLFVETKHPVRYGGLVESKLVAELHRFGMAAPPETERSRVVVMSFSASAVWRVRRTAPAVPTVLLGRSAAVLSSVAVGAVGATTVGPSISVLRERPELVARFREQGVGTYTWTVDDRADVELCRELGVEWVATNHPRTVRGWLDGTSGDAG
ncbi:glycerophosphodiester phosphodiesterase [Rhodococcus aerolatus]